LAFASRMAVPAALSPSERAADFKAASFTSAGRTVKRSPAPCSKARRAVEPEARISGGESACNRYPASRAWKDMSGATPVAASGSTRRRPPPGRNR